MAINTGCLALVVTRWCISVIIGALILALATPTEAAQRRQKWWQSGAIKTAVGLSDKQSDDLETIFQATRPKLRELMRRLSKEEADLSSLIHTMEVEESEATLQIDKVEAVRSELSKTRTLMIYRMHRELTAQQRDTLRELGERRRKQGWLAPSLSLLPPPLPPPRH